MGLEKVTAFILRTGENGEEQLVFRHHTAGVQLPAGTLEAGEQPEKAVVREVWEETGPAGRVARKMGVDNLPPLIGEQSDG